MQHFTRLAGRNFDPVCFLGALLMAVSCLLPAAALADTLIGDAADASALENGTTARTDLKKLYVGGGDGTYDYSAVFVFQLPDLGAVADPFITSSFSFNYNTRQGSGFPDVDLYGLGRRDTATVLSSDYYGETTVVDPTDATFLQSNILTSAVTSGNLVTTDSDGNAALIGYLNAQYDGGNGIGKYVFLRLSSNSPASVTSRYEVNASEAVVNSLPQPTIEYTAAGPPVDTIRAETQPDGSGVVAPPTALIQGSSLTAYAIARDSSMAYLSNTSATWSLVNITGSIVAGDLVAAADGKSATFTASGAGTAEIRAVNNSTNVVNSGTITVTPLTPPYGYQPNIVIVLADDLTWRHAGPYTEMPGGPTTIPANLTPNMDALAAEGMTFNYAFTAATTCSPCRHALYSGIHPVRNGGYPNHARHKTGTDTIVTHLQALGYQVRRNGKDHVDPASSYPWNSQANNPTPNTGDINLINGSHLPAKMAKPLIGSMTHHW